MIVDSNTLQNLLDICSSYKEIMLHLGYDHYTCNYKKLKKILNNGNYNYCKFEENMKRRKLSQLRSFDPMPNDQFFIFGKERKGRDCKIRMLKLGIPNKCSICEQKSIWNDKPLNLQIDHIDGDRCNNLLENLRLLCPNCHSQTETFAGKNVGLRKQRIQDNLFIKHKKTYYCIDCNTEVSKNGPKRCVSCSRKNRGFKWPSYQEVLILLKSVNNNYSKAAKKLGVSDNGIRKYLKRENPNFNKSCLL